MTLSELYEAINAALEDGTVTSDPAVTVERDGETLTVGSLRWEDGRLVLVVA